jgi:hypothetical protein
MATRSRFFEVLEAGRLDNSVGVVILAIFLQLMAVSFLLHLLSH